MQSLVVAADTSGPEVSSAAEAVDPNSGAVDRVIINFDRDIQDGTFTTADVATLSGPGGAITPSAVNKISSTQYEVVFASQTTAGSYTLVIGPSITDTLGNSMNQDGDGTNGEATQDQYTKNFTLITGAAAGQFDFGTASSPRATGYARIDTTTTNVAGLGYGWTSGNIGALDRGTANDVTRDANYTKDGTFAYNLTNGRYVATVTVGDTHVSKAWSAMQIYLEGALVDTVSTTAGNTATNAYSIIVADGQLNLRVASGNSTYVVLQSLVVAIDTSGPQVSSAAEVVDPNSGAVDRVIINFDRDIQDGTFTTADVATLSGPGGAITPSAVNKISSTQYEVVFASQTAAGAYTLVIGPNLTDTAGNSMNQDGDGTNGEATADQYTLNFTLTTAGATAGQFDFGTTTSPRAANYARIDNNTTNVAGLGYGWASGSVGAFDRGTADDITRDANYTKSATFAYTAINGNYDVTITVGDTHVSKAWSNMQIFLEGSLVDTVSTTAGQVVSNTYNVSISDGQLTIAFGNGSNYVIVQSIVAAFVAFTYDPSAEFDVLAETLYIAEDEPAESIIFPGNAPELPTLIANAIKKTPVAERLEANQDRSAAFAEWESPQERWFRKFDESSNVFNPHVAFGFESVFADQDQLADVFRRGLSR